MSENKHTPGPWIVGDDNGPVIYANEGGCLIASIETDNVDRIEVAVADAAFIVEACNAYDSLRADRDALAEAFVELDANMENHQDKPWFQYARNLVRTALARVGRL